MNRNERMTQSLIKYLHGELGSAEATEVERLMKADPALRADFETLRATWQGLDNPSPAAPDDFAARVLDSLEPATPGLRLSAWPAAVRWAAAGAVVSGVALGALVGATVFGDEPGDLLYAPPSLAESYVALIEEGE